MITGGFGMTMDLELGAMRQWTMGRDGVQRWLDNDARVDELDLELSETQVSFVDRLRQSGETK
jgi:hypothetical protein